MASEDQMNAGLLHCSPEDPALARSSNECRSSPLLSRGSCVGPSGSRLASNECSSSSPSISSRPSSLRKSSSPSSVCVRWWLLPAGPLGRPPLRTCSRSRGFQQGRTHRRDRSILRRSAAAAGPGGRAASSTGPPRGGFKAPGSVLSLPAGLGGPVGHYPGPQRSGAAPKATCGGLRLEARLESGKHTNIRPLILVKNTTFECANDASALAEALAICKLGLCKKLESFEHLSSKYAAGA